MIKIPVFFAIDESYSLPIKVAITSILINSKKNDSFDFYILYSNLSNITKLELSLLKSIKKFKINFLKIDMKEFEGFSKSLRKNNHFNLTNYYRIKIPSLTKYNKVIYLDSDLIVKESLSDLYKIKLKNYYLAAVKNEFTEEFNKNRLNMPNNSNYINSGVMLINCQLWRKGNIEKKLFEYILNNPPEKLLNVDQDAINAVLYKKIKILPKKWNIQIRTDVSLTKSYLKIKPYIIHYLGYDKPWLPNTKHNKKQYNMYSNIMKKYITTTKNNKIKILFFNHTAGLGGSERSLLELIDELQELGAICHVILPYKGPLSDELEKKFIDYQIINYHWWCSQEKLSDEEKRKRMSESFFNLINHKRILDLWNADLIFTNTLTIPWGSIYAQITNKPHVTFIREFGTLDFGFDFFYGFKESMKYINDNSDYVFTNSIATKNYFDQFIDNKKLDYAYTYINIEKKLLKEKIIDSFNNKSSLKIFLSGGIMPSKGQKHAVLAVKNLIDKGSKNIELILIGGKHDQNYINDIEKIIKENNLDNNIKIINFLTNPYPILKQADLCLMCSKCESYGRVTIEAMSQKKPIIGTNSGATPEFIKNNFNGFLYDYGNFNQLADKIEFFYKNKKQLKIMGKNSYKLYKKTFSKKNYGLKLYRIMKNLIKTKKTNDINNKMINNLILNLSNKFFEIEENFKKLKEEINNKTQEIHEQNQKINQLTEENNQLKSALHKIYTSKTWKLLYWYKKLISVFRRK